MVGSLVHDGEGRLEYQAVTIAHYGPGYIAYGPADPFVLRTLMLTWARTLLLLHCVHAVSRTTHFENTIKNIGESTATGPGSQIFADRVKESSVGA